MKADSKARIASASFVLLCGFFSQTALGADGIWTQNGNSTWSSTGSWSGGTIADGAGFTADFSQLNITSNRTVTIDGAAASRTIGTLLFGDIDSTHNYTISTSSSGTLTFDNNGTAAAISQGVNSGANTISAPVLLAGSLNFNNGSANLLTFSSSGTISASTSGTKTITNQGTSTGGVTLGGIISNGSGSVAIVQDSATSILTLSGANTYSGGTTIRSGTLIVTTNATALGSGSVLLGHTSGSSDATLSLGTGDSTLIANNITVQAGGTGQAILAVNGSAAGRSSGSITLNNHLTLEVAAGGFGGRNTGAFLATSGAIGGTGNLNLNITGALTTTNDGGASQMDSINVLSSVGTTGSISNVGTGTGRALISGNITGAGSVNQNSATSQLSLSGTNTYSGATNVNAGVLRITTNTALSANSSSINVADGATLQLQNGSTALNAGQTLNIAGHGTAYSQGAIESVNNANYAGTVVLLSDSTIASDSTTTLTLSGTITGTNRSLTTAGIGSVVISGNIETGSGGLTKEGTGTTTLSGTNAYTGATRINHGTLLVTSAGALSDGDITFGGGVLRHSSTNVLDYSSRIVKSTGPVAIDTGGVTNVTYANDIASSNSGGLLKTGTGRLTLSGTNTFTGPIVVNNGALAVSAAGALPSQVFIDSGGALNSGGAYTGVSGWTASGMIDTASTGVIALTGSSSENINLSGFGTLGLGASSNSTYSGTLIAAGSTYRLGGGGATLTVNATNALTGANNLSVNGLVTLTGANNLTGATTVSSGTLTLSGAGGLASSVVTVGQGTTLTVTTATTGSAVTRAAGVTLNRGVLSVAGNATANSIDEIAGTLAVGSGGHSTLTINANAARNARVNVGGFTRTSGGTAVFRGQDLGVSPLGTPTNGDTNLLFTTPNLVGNGGAGTDRSIFVGVVGDISHTGNGFGASGGLLTQDATNGVRRLSGADYKTSITDGQTALDNVQLASTGTTATTTLATATAINSLSLNSTSTTGANIQITGVGTLKLNSGVIYANSVTATTTSAIGNTIDFNGREGIVLLGGSADLTLSGVLSNTAGNGLTVYAPSRTLTLSGTSANTYTGTTTINGGTLVLNKTTGVDAIAGDLMVNIGGSVSMVQSNGIADTANIILNGGGITLRNETVNNFTILNGSTTSSPQNTNSIALTVNGDLTVSGTGSAMRNSIAGNINVAGATNLSDGGAITLARSQNVLGVYDSVATLGGALNITHTSSGTYTPITIGHGSGLGQSGAKLILGGDITFTGNSTNTNTVLIDAIKGSGRQGVIELTATAGNRTMNIGNGAAATDFAITAALLDGAGASGLVKSGQGTLELRGANSYTGTTAVNSGKLVINGNSSTATGNLSVASGAILGGVGAIGGATTINGILAPGNSIGTLTVDNDVTWNGAASPGAVTDWQFELGLANAADLLDLTGSGSDFLKGTGDIFRFDFMGSAESGTFKLVDWLDSNATTFTYSDFSFTNLGGGNTGSFSITGSQLNFTVIPEPQLPAIVGAFGIIVLLRRRRHQ